MHGSTSPNQSTYPISTRSLFIAKTYAYYGSPHSQSLLVLGVRSRMAGSNLIVYESDPFEEICNNCLELRQLGITFPITSVSNADPSSDFTAYLVTSRSCSCGIFLANNTDQAVLQKTSSPHYHQLAWLA